MKNALRHILAFLLVSFIDGYAFAGEHDHSGREAHMHGEWTLFVARDEDRLTVMLAGPLLDALGFERAPQDEDERANAEALSKTLSDIDNVVALPAAARCETKASTVSYPWSAKDHPDDGAEFSHDGHAGDGRGHGEEHGHEEESDHHAMNVEAEYILDCATPDRLSQFRTRLFETLPAVATVRATYISHVAQTQKALTEKSPVMRLK